jgi:HAD superfamily hydrolase (TIGR01509 family)
MTFLIFDCDGVLVDSEAIALDVLAQAITALGHPTDAAECRSLFMGKSLKDVLIGIETLTGRPLPSDWGHAANTQLFARFAAELRPVAGIAAAIESLPYPRCVASSSQFDRIRLSLAVTGLAPLFGKNVFSATEVAQGKPAPDLFLHAAAACGFVPAETIVIEDSPSGVTAALRAGMTAIGFAGASHADAELAQALDAAGATIVLTEMAALPDAVAQMRAVQVADGQQPQSAQGGTP